MGTSKWLFQFIYVNLYGSEIRGTTLNFSFSSLQVIEYSLIKPTISVEGKFLNFYPRDRNLPERAILNSNKIIHNHNIKLKPKRDIFAVKHSTNPMSLKLGPYWRKLQKDKIKKVYLLVVRCDRISLSRRLFPVNKF